jgi:hypothetical protein
MAPVAPAGAALLWDRVRALPTLAATAAATLVFLLVLLVAARSTRDLAGPVPDALRTVPREAFLPPPAPAGDVPAVEEPSPHGASLVDSGAPPLGPEPAPPEWVDAGPVGVAGPPFDASALVLAAVPDVERCAKDALRWDPSLGGAFTVVVNLDPEAPPRITTVGIVSPVWSACLQRTDASPLLGLLQGPLEQALVVRARAALDGVQGQVTVADPVIGYR